MFARALATNASVACKDGAIRLRGGGAPYQGRLEMCYRGHWGTVCQNSWDETDALAVCRILGYGASNLAIPTTLDFFSPIPSPLGPVFVKEVECTGNETNFLDCLVSQPGGETCFHARDAGVFCSGVLAATLSHILNFKFNGYCNFQVEVLGQCY